MQEGAELGYGEKLLLPRYRSDSRDKTNAKRDGRQLIKTLQEEETFREEERKDSEGERASNEHKSEIIMM